MALPDPNRGKEFPTRVVSGIQPVEEMHLGQFFGAVQQHIELQHSYPGECFYFIADYHALTAMQDPQTLQRRSANVWRAYLALGLDPDCSYLYRQSDVPQICELMWILSCITAKGLLDRAHAYKRQARRGTIPSVGLFLYPELQAADILGLRATIVPAGLDQAQHLEIARDIACRLNSKVGEPVVPEPKLLESDASEVPGTDGIRNMKTEHRNIVPIFAAEEVVKQAIMRIRTQPIAKGTPINPSNDTVLKLLKLVGREHVVAEVGSGYSRGAIGFEDAKHLLINEFFNFFGTARDAYCELSNHPLDIEEILQIGGQVARREVAQTVENIREALELTPLQRFDLTYAKWSER